MGTPYKYLRNRDKTKFALVTTPELFPEKSLVTIINVTPFAKNSYTKETMLVRQNEIDDIIKINSLKNSAKLIQRNFMNPEYMFINNKEHIIPVIKFYFEVTLRSKNLFYGNLTDIPKNSINVFMPFGKKKQISTNDYEKCRIYHKEITYEGEIPTIKDVLSIINKQFLVSFCERYEKNNHDVEKLYKYMCQNPQFLKRCEDWYKKECIRTYKNIKRIYGVSYRDKLDKYNTMAVQEFIRNFIYPKLIPFKEPYYSLFFTLDEVILKVMKKIVEDKLKIKIV